MGKQCKQWLTLFFWPPKSLQMVTERKVKVKVKLCLTLCDPIGCSLPGSSVHGILQARPSGPASSELYTFSLFLALDKRKKKSFSGLMCVCVCVSAHRGKMTFLALPSTSRCITPEETRGWTETQGGGCSLLPPTPAHHGPHSKPYCCPILSLALPQGITAVASDPTWKM